MEYTPQHAMFNHRAKNILSMYNNAPEILKGASNEELAKQEGSELPFEGKAPEAAPAEGQDVTKGEDTKPVEGEGAEGEKKEDKKEDVEKSEGFDLEKALTDLGSPLEPAAAE